MSPLIYLLFLLQLSVAADPSAAVLADKEKGSQSTNAIHIRTTVVVTATRTEVELGKSPASASVITREDLEMSNTQLVDQSLSLLPGVHAFRTKGPQDTSNGVGMRGFNGRGVDGSRVLVLLNSQPMNSAYDGAVQWTTVPVDEVDRVEVVRGPFSSLYGGNAMGGVVSITTRPVENRQVDISAQYGSHKSVLYSGSFSDRFWNRLGLRAGYQRLQNGGYSVQGVFATASSASTVTGPLVTGAIPFVSTTGTKRYAVGEQGDNWYNQHAWWMRGEYALAKSSTVSFQYMRRRYGYGYKAYGSFLKNEAGSPVDSGTVFFYDGALRRATLSTGSFLGGPGGGESNLAGAQLLHAFSPRSHLRVTGGVSDLSSEWFTTPSNSATLTGGTGTTADRPSRSWHGEAQWNWIRSSRHNIVMGAAIRNNSSSAAEYELSNYALRDSRLRLTASSAGKDSSQAIFAQDQIRVGKRLLLIVGGRFDNWSSMDGAANPYFGAELITYPSRDANSFSGKISALYEGPSQWIIRAGAGNSFRNPSVYELFRSWRSSSGIQYLSNPDLQPERLTSWETGVRKKFGTRIDLDAGYFENHVRDLIYRSTDLKIDSSGKTRVFSNAGKSRTRGVEITVQQNALSWLQLRQSYTWNDAGIMRNDFAPQTVGKQVPYVPRHIASFVAIAGRKQWTATLNGRYVGRLFSNDSNSDTIKGVPGAYDPYFELGGSVSYAFESQVTLTCSADNLLDRLYYQYYRTPGRTISAGLRFRLK
ncbi:MAG: TonB-dependent receptor [Acidobacteria bacterium]|nr:TonB-dependent receptor [Acidobacteriota bacterium]